MQLQQQNDKYRTALQVRDDEIKLLKEEIERLKKIIGGPIPIPTPPVPNPI